MWALIKSVDFGVAGWLRDGIVPVAKQIQIKIMHHLLPIFLRRSEPIFTRINIADN